MKKLSLVIPCYNEEKTLESCIKSVLKLQSDKLDLELIIVDDCSSDNSMQVAETLCSQYPEITLYKHEVNKGKGAALKTGFLHATGDYVGIQDADLEYNPLDYLILLQPLIEEKADVVYGSRYVRSETRHVLYFWHTCMNKLLTITSNMFTNLDITDMETCYKLFRRDVIQSIAPSLKEERFGFEPEITIKVANNRYKVYECALSYNPRTYEEGKKIGWKDGVHALYCILHYGAHKAPLPMQIILYFFIGLMSFTVNMGVFFTLFKLDCSLTASIIAASLVSAVVNYLLCIAILFQHKAQWKAPKEISIYFLIVLSMLAFDYWITVGLIAVSFSIGWAKAIAALSGFVINFFTRKFLVFHEKKV